MRRGGGPRGLVLYVAAFLVLATLCLLSVNARAAYNVTIDSPSEDDIVEGVVVINGSLSHEGSPEPDAVSVRINGTWRDAVDVNGGGGNWTSWLFTWRSGTVPNGPIRIDVAARDGFNYLGMVSVNVTVNNTPPVVAITKATPATVVVGSFVTLEGEVLSVGSGSTITQYRWVSDIDSHIGNVANTTCFLSVGNHTIRFRAMNDIGTWSDPVAVNVLVTPVDSLRFPGGDLTLSGYDPEDIDVADIERGWFFATGARDALGNLVPYTGQIITAIIHVNGILYVTLENGTILALDGAGLADEAQGRMVDSADVLWSTHLGRVTTGSLVYHDGVLFVGTEDGYVYALDALTGKADVWPVEGSFQWVGDESISGNALTVIQGFLVFGSYDEVAGQGNVWVLDIEDGSIVDKLPIEKRPIQRPLPVGDRILLPVNNMTDGILEIEITKRGEIDLVGRMEIPHYVMGISAYRGLLVVVTRPSAANSMGVIYLYDYARQRVAEYHPSLEFYNPATFAGTPDGDRILVAGVYHESYAGGRSWYRYENGYILVLDRSLRVVDTFELNGTPSTAPLVYGDTALVSTYNGTLYAFDIRENRTVEGWPLEYEDYGRGMRNQTLSTTQLVRFGRAIAFGSFDTILYTLGGEVVRPLAEIVSVTPPGEEGGPLEAYYGTRIRFVGRGSSLVSKSIVRYWWNSSIDGLLATTPTFAAVLSPGQHDIQFTVQDEDNVTSIPHNFTYVVHNNSFPEARLANRVSTVEVDKPLILSLATSEDPDGDSISFIVDFGDGTNLTFTDDVVTHVYRREGNYTIHITPVDEHGVAGATIEVPVAVVVSEEAEDDMTILCLAAIGGLVLLIVVLALVYLRTKSGVDRVDEEEEEEAEGATPEGKEPRETEPPSDVLEGFDVSDVSLDELSVRVRALLEHKWELEEFIEEEEEEP